MAGLRELQTADGLGDELLRRVRDIENQRVGRLFEVRELASEDRFAGKMAVAGFDVMFHLVVGAAQIDDAKIEAGGELVAVALLQARNRPGRRFG